MRGRIFQSADCQSCCLSTFCHPVFTSLPLTPSITTPPSSLLMTSSFSPLPKVTFRWPSTRLIVCQSLQPTCSIVCILFELVHRLCLFSLCCFPCSLFCTPFRSCFQHPSNHELFPSLRRSLFFHHVDAQHHCSSDRVVMFNLCLLLIVTRCRHQGSIWWSDCELSTQNGRCREHKNRQ